ncbi:acyltransferase [Xanthobacter autotrophicus DSM 431]|uniref:acyltransferase family protein n=1 Tax=Xanthobacter nonsaccharivorans TaxID=3119912 RepID=UPI0037270721
MQNFVSIESLRAYMAWWVVLGHASHLTRAADFLPQPVVRLIERGDIAVNVFIIISGFVITHLLASKKENYAPYLTRRFFRIFPVYLFCLILAIAITDLYQAAYFHTWVVGVDMRQARALEESSNFFTHLGLHLTLLHGILPDTFLPFASSTFLAPAWSLSLEWQFYLVAPVLIFLLSRSSIVMLATVGVSLIVFAIVHTGKLGTWAYPSFLPISIQYFLIGILSRQCLGRLRQQGLVAEPLIVLAALIALLAGPLEALIWIVFLAFTMMEMGVLRLQTGALEKLANVFVFNPLVARVGTWSYSTYLIHIPVFSIVVGGATLMLPAVSQALAVVLVLLSLPLVLLVSWCTFMLVEKPFNGFGRQLAKRMSETRSRHGYAGSPNS